MSKSVEKKNKISKKVVHKVSPVPKLVMCQECGLPWDLHNYANPYECIRLLKQELGKSKAPFDCSGFLTTSTSGSNIVPGMAFQNGNHYNGLKIG